MIKRRAVTRQEAESILMTLKAAESSISSALVLMSHRVLAQPMDKLIKTLRDLQRASVDIEESLVIQDDDKNDK